MAWVRFPERFEIGGILVVGFLSCAASAFACRVAGGPCGEFLFRTVAVRLVFDDAHAGDGLLEQSDVDKGFDLLFGCAKRVCQLVGVDVTVREVAAAPAQCHDVDERGPWHFITEPAYPRVGPESVVEPGVTVPHFGFSRHVMSPIPMSMRMVIAPPSIRIMPNIHSQSPDGLLRSMRFNEPSMMPNPMTLTTRAHMATKAIVIVLPVRVAVRCSG